MLKQIKLILPLFVLSTTLCAKTSFVQILTDDQGWGDASSYGHQHIKTPHIDAIGENGVKFTHGYSPDAVCSPSRASILTGRTPFRNGVYRFLPWDHFCHLPASEITLPQLLRKNGYTTAHFGKWHLFSYADISEKSVGKDGKKVTNWVDFKFGHNKEEPSMHDYGTTITSPLAMWRARTTRTH